MALYRDISRYDRSLNIEMLVDRIANDYGIDKDKAVSVVQGFWQSLSEQITHGEIDRVMNQLPKKMQKVFIGGESLML